MAKTALPDALISYCNSGNRRERLLRINHVSGQLLSTSRVLSEFAQQPCEVNEVSDGVKARQSEMTDGKKPGSPISRAHVLTAPPNPSPRLHPL